MEYSYHLQQRFPALEITAEVLQPPFENRIAASIIGYAQVALFAVSFFGDQIFAALSMPVPDAAKYVQENRGMSIAGFFMGNMVVSSMTQTGAFEIFLGGEVVHSKIKTGVVPDFPSLIDKISKMRPTLGAMPPNPAINAGNENHAANYAATQGQGRRGAQRHVEEPRVQVPVQEDDDDEEF